jgi:hypothetical protein
MSAFYYTEAIMKKIFLISVILMLGAGLFAQGITGRGSSEDYGDVEQFEANKTKTEVIVPKDFHTEDTTASVKIEYSPVHDEVRIYYECMNVTYDEGQAMNAVLECLNDFRIEKDYNRYYNLRDPKTSFKKDDKGRRKAIYMRYVKFVR